MPAQIIYLSIARSITDLMIRNVDQNGRLLDFRGEEITVRLHVLHVIDTRVERTSEIGKRRNI